MSMKHAVSWLQRGAPSAVLCFVVLTLPASAHYTQSMFTYSDCNAQRPTDPLNLVLYGPLGGNSLNSRYAEFARITGWLQAKGGKQYFRSHGGCYAQRTQRSLQAGDDVGDWKRHSRFFAMPGVEGHGWQVDFGDAHYERKVTCRDGGKSDAVYPKYNSSGSGFDAAARNVAVAYDARGQYYGPAYFRMDHQRQTYKQCNNQVVGWNGHTWPIYTTLKRPD